MTDNSNDVERMQLNRLCSKGKSSLRQKDVEDDGPYLVYGASGVVGRMSVYQNEHPYVAVVKDGAGVGRAMLCAGKTSVLGTMQALLPKEGTNLSYLLHLVRSLRLGEDYSGSTIPHIYFRDYGKRMVPVPTVSRQAAVAGILDSIGRLESSCDARCSKLDELVKSRFVEMFGAESWPSRPIHELATDIRYGTSKKATNEGKYTYLRMNNMTDDGKLDFNDTKRITLSGTELEKCLVRNGDVLFNRTNSREKVGKTAVFESDQPMVIAGYIIRVRLGSELRSRYFAAYMNLPHVKKMLQAMAKGAVHQANINARQLGAIDIPVPPVPLQDEFIDFTRYIDKLRAETQRQKQDLQTLYDSLAQEYFAM